MEEICVWECFSGTLEGHAMPGPEINTLSSSLQLFVVGLEMTSLPCFRWDYSKAYFFNFSGKIKF